MIKKFGSGPRQPDQDPGFSLGVRTGQSCHVSASLLKNFIIRVFSSDTNPVFKMRLDPDPRFKIRSDLKFPPNQTFLVVFNDLIYNTISFILTFMWKEKNIE